MESQVSLQCSQVPPLVYIVSHNDVVHICPNHMFKMYVNIVLPSMPSSYQMFSSVQVSKTNLFLVENVF
jgi:hypothetical protein